MMSRIKNKAQQFNEGDQVWLDSRNLKLAQESRKFKPRREGPFIIDKVLGSVTYRLKLPPGWQIHPVYHASLLTPYIENDTHGPSFTKPPPDLIDNQEEFEIEAIISHRRKGNQWQYLIKWKGYPTSDNSWETEDNLEHSQETLSEYKKRHNLANLPTQSTRRSTRRKQL